GAALALCPRQGQRSGSMAPVAHRLERLSPDNFQQLAAVYLPGGFIDVDGGFCSRHPGFVSHFPEEGIADRAEVECGEVVFTDYNFLHGGRNHRRDRGRKALRPHWPQAGDDSSRHPGSKSDSTMGGRSHVAFGFSWGLSDAVHGPGRVGRDSGPYQRTLPKYVARVLSRFRLPDGCSVLLRHILAGGLTGREIYLFALAYLFHADGDDPGRACDLVRAGRKGGAFWVRRRFF